KPPQPASSPAARSGNTPPETTLPPRHSGRSTTTAPAVSSSVRTCLVESAPPAATLETKDFPPPERPPAGYRPQSPPAPVARSASSHRLCVYAGLRSFYPPARSHRPHHPPA